jgi:hypothetical protein
VARERLALLLLAAFVGGAFLLVFSFVGPAALVVWPIARRVVTS